MKMDFQFLISKTFRYLYNSMKLLNKNKNKAQILTEH